MDFLFGMVVGVGIPVAIAGLQHLLIKKEENLDVK